MKILIAVLIMFSTASAQTRQSEVGKLLDDTKVRMFAENPFFGLTDHPQDRAIWLATLKVGTMEAGSRLKWDKANLRSVAAEYPAFRKAFHTKADLLKYLDEAGSRDVIWAKLEVLRIAGTEITEYRVKELTATRYVLEAKH